MRPPTKTWSSNTPSPKRKTTNKQIVNEFHFETENELGTKTGKFNHLVCRLLFNQLKSCGQF